MVSKVILLPYIAVALAALAITLTLGQDTSEVTEAPPTDLSKFRCRNASCSGKRVKICQQAASESTSVLFMDQVNGDNKCQCCFEKAVSRRKLRRIWAKARKNVNKNSSPANGETTVKPELSTFAELPSVPPLMLAEMTP